MALSDMAWRDLVIGLKDGVLSVKNLTMAVTIRYENGPKYVLVYVSVKNVDTANKILLEL